MATIQQPELDHDHEHDDDIEDTSRFMLSPEEGRKLFDEAALHWVGLTGEEFLRRWDAGEYRNLPDTPAGWRIMHVVHLISFARQDLQAGTRWRGCDSH